MRRRDGTTIEWGPPKPSGTSAPDIAYPFPMTEHVSHLVTELAGLDQPELRKRLGAVIDQLTISERFELLHQLRVYHHPESWSGAASTLRETAVLRRALPSLVAELGIERLLDIPCGDFHWMQHVQLTAEYIGADIVPEIVAFNRDRYGAPRRSFLMLDATADTLPTADLILCRDLLIHLSLADCWAALSRFVGSGSRYLLTNHFVERARNPEIVTGDFRPINLERPPFNFPPPLRIIREESDLGSGSFRDRSMALWRLSDLAERIGQERAT